VRLIKGLQKVLPGICRGFKSIIPDALAIAGAFLIWKGVDALNRPAGLMVAGVLCIAAAVVWSKGADSR